MKLQSVRFAWKITAALAAAAGLSLLAVCAVLGNGVSWVLPILGSASVGLAGAILVGCSAMSQLRAAEMLPESQRAAMAERQLDEARQRAETVRRSSPSLPEIAAIASQANVGRAGMGFAAATNEPRNLAQWSAQAPSDTAVLIEALDSHSRSLLALADKLQSTSGASPAIEPQPSQAQVDVKRSAFPHARADAQARRFPD